MAKTSYRIPDSLDKSTLDTEITFKTNEGVGFRPVSLRLVAWFSLSMVALLVICLYTYVGKWLPLTIPFCISWFVLTLLLLKTDKTGEMQYSQVDAILSYYPKSQRYVICRSAAKAGDLWSVVGVKSRDAETGLIQWNDGTVGYAYLVVGTGSLLLFDADRDAIIDSVDSFYRKTRPSVEWIWVTTKEPQKVYRQVAALKRRYDALDDPTGELAPLLDMEYACLSDFVGREYRSLHQYLFIKADSMEELILAQNHLQAEVEGGRMIRQLVGLVGEDLDRVYRTIYQGRESV